MNKTLFACFDFPPLVNGASTYNYDMIRSLPREKTIILAPRVPGHEKFDQMFGYKIYRIPKSWMEKIRIPYLSIIIPWIAIKEQVEFIWFTKYSRIILLGTIFTKYVLDIDYGLTVYGEDLAWASSNFPKSLSRLSLKFQSHILLGASKIVANSQYTGSLLPPKTTFHVIYPCLPENEISQTRFSNDRVTKTNDQITFLTVANLSRKKGIDLVLKALAMDLPGIDKMRYIIVGDGDAKSSLSKLANELMISQYVEFTGRLDNQAKWKFYNQADVFVMPSKIEGFGIVFLEAAFIGICSIASKSGGIPEAIEDGSTGILVNSGQVEELRDAMALLGKDQALRNKLAANARNRCINKFMYRRFAQEWRLCFETP